MKVTARDVEGVMAFRNRLVEFLNYIDDHSPKGYGERMGDTARKHVAQEQAGLAQDYGRVYRFASRYGVAQMTQFNRIASQDVVRDAIGSLDFPSYGALASMAVRHLDQTIGHLQAEVESAPSRGEMLIRVTSLAFWAGRLVALLRWLALTARGRIVAIATALVVVIIQAVVSGAAQAWFSQVLNK